MVIQGKHLLLLFLLLVPALLFSACGPTPAFHCEAMPFYVQYKGISYYAVYAYSGRALRESDLGSAITTVGNGQNQATSCQLDAGTQVYTVKGYQPTFRLAAHYNGITLFEIAYNSQAKTGADLLDIDGKVQSISLDSTRVNSQGTPVTTSNQIKDPQQVSALLKMILTAPVDMKHCQQQGNVQDITFHLKDGTATERRYWVGNNEMQGCILLPKDFGVALSSSH